MTASVETDTEMLLHAPTTVLSAITRAHRYDHHAYHATEVANASPLPPATHHTLPALSCSSGILKLFMRLLKLSRIIAYSRSI